MIYTWIRIEDLSASEIEDTRIIEIKAGTKTICILKKNGRLFAFAATCPHQGAPFCEGWLDIQGRIVCPLHKYRFDPSNGRNTSGEGYKLRTYPVEIREDFIYIGLME